MTFPAQLLSFISFAQSQQAFATVGTYNFTVPSGVTMMSAVATGGGGGGAGSNAGTGNGTGGGGGGGTSWGVFSVEPGDILQIVVGSGGTGGTSAGGNGQNGEASVVRLASRGGVTKNQTIIQGNGGSGGTRAAGTGIGGAGGSYSLNTSPDGSFTIFVGAGGTGGSGGSSDSGGGGGGGAGGYRGNGGNGGRLSPTVIAPTAAVLNSGGGGGGGGVSVTAVSNVGYGGGGTGSYGYSGSGQGDAGTNSPNNTTLGSGGKGASNFLDPGFAINADKVGNSISTTTSINYPTGLQKDDFLLLLSGSDRFTGNNLPATNFTTILPPAGFTELFRSIDGEYPVSGVGSIADVGAGKSIVPVNISGAATPTRDLNFTASYRYVPTGGLTGSLTGLTTSSIHNMIALRYIPSDASIKWANDSVDPSSNVGAGEYTLMPNPPGVLGISSNSIGIAIGFLSNTVLNPGNNIAGENTTLIGFANGGVSGLSGEGVGLVASYYNVSTGTTTFNPDPFLTGTTAHSRAYSIEVRRVSAGSPVSVVGAYTTTTWINPATGNPGALSISLPTTGPNGLQNNDLLLHICASDSPGAASGGSVAINGVTFNVLPGGALITLPGGGDDFDGQTDDTRGTIGGLGFVLRSGVWQSGDGNTTTTLTPAGSTGTPAAHMIIHLRNASITYSSPPVYSVFDNASTPATYGPPDPPSITTGASGSMILAIGMIDNITISNVTGVDPPTGYTMLDEQSYGVQNNGLIIMSAYRQILTDLVQENPLSFVGGGGNIWASSTLIVSGNNVSGQTNGTQNAPGLYGGGGGSYADDVSGSGMSGAQGGVRLIWGSARQYPSTNQGNAPERL